MKAIFRATVCRFEYLLDIEPAPSDSSRSGFNRPNQKTPLGFTPASTPNIPEESLLINNPPEDLIENISKYGARGSGSNQNPNNPASGILPQMNPNN
jgi:hypothetical protein